MDETKLCKFRGKPDAEPCPFCGQLACNDHGVVVDIIEEDVEDDELWACQDCFEKLPDKSEEHWFGCAVCQEDGNEDGCPEYQTLNAEDEQISAQRLEKWKNSTLLGSV